MIGRLRRRLGAVACLHSAAATAFNRRREWRMWHIDNTVIKLATADFTPLVGKACLLYGQMLRPIRPQTVQLLNCSFHAFWTRFSSELLRGININSGLAAHAVPLCSCRSENGQRFWVIWANRYLYDKHDSESRDGIELADKFDDHVRRCGRDEDRRRPIIATRWDTHQHFVT